MSNFFYRNLKRTYPVIESARGVWITDGGGHTCLDACSGAIVANIGYGVEEVNEAIAAQLSKAAFAHTSQYVSQAGLELAQGLVGLTGDEFRSAGGSDARVYFTSGGSESVETALKLARAYFFELGQRERQFVISRRPSYHGSTFGALAVTGHPARRIPYEDILPAAGNQLCGDHIKSPYPYRCICGSLQSCQSDECSLAYAGELEAAIQKLGANKVMAFIAEPIVGAALGAATPGAAYWPRVREICTRYGVLLIADEVMTGLGRVGANFGLDLFHVHPDIVALGKGLSAGYMPLGAVMASGKVVSAFEKNSGIFEHGFTYSGHPVAAAAGLSVLRFMEKHALISRVAQHESKFFARLNGLKEKYEIVGDVRGRGYMAGLELVEDRKTKKPFAPAQRVGMMLAARARELGLLIYPGSAFLPEGLGDHVMIAPPFVISEDEMNQLFERLEQALQSITESLYNVASTRSS